MRVLVTGCAGFIGSHLCEQLVDQGHDVVGVDCFTDYYERGRKEANLSLLRDSRQFDLREIDLSHADLHGLVDDIDLVYHQAAQPGVRASWGKSFEGYARHNVLATQRLLEEAKGKPIRKFVYASSSSIYGDAEGFPTSEDALPQPVSPYGVTKLGGEQLVYLYWRNYGLPTVSLRYFTVYGPRQRPDMAFHRFIRSAIGGEPITVFGDGEQTRDFTFVKDIIAANLRAGMGESVGKAFNIGGGSRVSVNDVLVLIEDLVGQPVLVRRQEQQHGDVRHTSADIRAASRELGYTPTVDLRQGLHAEIDWLSTHTPVLATP